MSSVLLKGGTVLIHGDGDKITPTKTDVLVQNSRIARIEPFISAPDGCDVIDCTDKIVSPGLVDTHHHMWQSPLKGQFGDSAFAPYMTKVATVGLSFKPGDFFWANLAGNMEAIDAGTTTSLDHAHMNWSPEHSKHALAGTLSSGMRSVFGYTPTLTLAATSPEVQFSQDLLPAWFLPTLEQLAAAPQLAAPSSRVRLGLAFDMYFLPEPVVQHLFARARALGASTVTSHYGRYGGGPAASTPALLRRYGLLDGRVVLSHAGEADAADAALLAEAGTFVSCTPSTELAMAVGPPVAFRGDHDEDLPGMQSVCALGVDSHAITGGSLVNEMRTGLQVARGRDSQAHLDRGVFPARLRHTMEEAFNLGTVQGARALGMADEVGSIAVGKKADLVVWEALSPAMMGAAQVDPVMAIVLHSSIGDVDTVLVDGQVRKRQGKMLPVKATEWRDGEGFIETGEAVGWREVAARVLEIQKRYLSKLEELDLPKIEQSLSALLHLKH